MSAIFSQADFAELRKPHVCRGMFLELALPSGTAYLHNGTGRYTLDGKEWRGVSDPVSGRLVSLQGIEDPRFGQATRLQVVLGGANLEFFRSVYQSRDTIEGVSAKLYFAVMNAENNELRIPLRLIYDGFISSPELRYEGKGQRTVSIVIESRWASQNYPPVGRWSPSGQRKRYPGDKGLDFLGVEVAEEFQ